MCRPIRDRRLRRPRDLNRSWDDVLAHICLPTIPAKLSAQVSVVLHSSISREDARAWNYNRIDRNGTRDRQRKGETGRERKRGGEEEKEPERNREEGEGRFGKPQKQRETDGTSGKNEASAHACVSLGACVYVRVRCSEMRKKSNERRRSVRISSEQIVRLNSRARGGPIRTRKIDRRRWKKKRSIRRTNVECRVSNGR